MSKLSKLKRRKIEEQRRKAVYTASLKKGKKLHKNPFRYLDALCEGKTPYWMCSEESGQHRIGVIFQQLWNNDNYIKQRESFYDLLKALINTRAGRLLDDYQVVGGLRSLSLFQHKWMRDLSDWKPKSHNREKIFSQLTRHLLAEYKVPEFMNDALYNGFDQQINWFIHVGQGGNIRKAKAVPLQLSKKMAHYFLQAPTSYTIPEAFRYGQVLGWGGSPKLVRYLIKTRLGQSFENEHFWSTVVQFFVNNCPGDPNRINDIIDYIHHQKYENRRIVTGRGQITDLGPAQPDFSMKGRSLNALLRDTHQWRLEMKKWEKEFKGETWEPVSIPDFEWVENEGTIEQKHYRLTQLLTGDELYLEGKKMSHCVGSYVEDCVSKDCSIWSLTVEDVLKGKKRLATIELDNKGTFEQAKAKYNDDPSQEAWQVMIRWAEANNLKIPKCLLD